MKIVHRFSVLVCLIGILVSGMCYAEYRERVTFDALERTYEELVAQQHITPKQAQVFAQHARSGTYSVGQQKRLKKMILDVIDQAGGAVRVFGKEFASIMNSPVFTDWLVAISTSALTSAFIAAATAAVTGDPFLVVETALWNGMMVEMGRQFALSSARSVLPRLSLPAFHQELAESMLVRSGGTAALGLPIVPGLGYGVDIATTVVNHDPQLRALKENVIGSALKLGKGWATTATSWLSNQASRVVRAASMIDFSRAGEIEGVR